MVRGMRCVYRGGEHVVVLTVYRDTADILTGAGKVIEVGIDFLRPVRNA